MTQPHVGVVMGSSSDWDTMQHAALILQEFGVAFETRVVSAHRMPDDMFAYAEAAHGRGLRAIIAGAGGAAHLPGAPPRILVIQAPYYRNVVEGMRQGAMTVFQDLKAEVETVDVAGGYELPAALRMAMKARRRWDGYLLLGCVVKGETDHYTFICEAICKGVMDISVESGAPIGFGLLTVDSLAQAEARSRPDRMNKGVEAAHALVSQIALARGWGLA